MPTLKRTPCPTPTPTYRSVGCAAIAAGWAGVHGLLIKDYVFEYPNRFIDYPLIKVRLMHWFNWRYKLSGYLHYGFNRWTKNPFADTEESAPAGDRFIIYPGKNGPMNSIRWEMSRESIEDYEYLWLLANSKSNVQSKSNPTSENDCPTNPSSDELCRMLVKSFTNYTTDPAELYRVRDLIATEIMKKNPENKTLQ